MFVRILLRDLARDFGVEFERLRHREIFEISARADKKLWGGTLNVFWSAFTLIRKHTIEYDLTYQN